MSNKSFELNTDINKVNKISLTYYIVSIVLLLLPFYSAYGLISFSGFQIISMGWSSLWIYLLVALGGLVVLFVKNFGEYEKRYQKFSPIVMGLIALWALLEGFDVAGMGLWVILIVHIAMAAYQFLPEIQKLINKK